MLNLSNILWNFAAFNLLFVSFHFHSTIVWKIKNLAYTPLQISFWLIKLRTHRFSVLLSSYMHVYGYSIPRIIKWKEILFMILHVSIWNMYNLQRKSQIIYCMAYILCRWNCWVFENEIYHVWDGVYGMSGLWIIYEYDYIRP